MLERDSAGKNCGRRWGREGGEEERRRGGSLHILVDVRDVVVEHSGEDDKSEAELEGTRDAMSTRKSSGRRSKESWKCL